MDWVRGPSIGRGSFAFVHLAIPTNNNNTASSPINSPAAVKSAGVLTSSSLKNEKQVLDCLGFCPQIVRCFGDDYSFENGGEFYNLFLEYAAGGNLADHIRSRHGGKLPECDVRRYTSSILKGIKHVHEKGFVHCDIKLQNVLLFDNGDVKIADFGLARKTTTETGDFEKQRISEWRGTPLFMSPESVNHNVYESPADIWSLGCSVVEMITGKSAWNGRNNNNNICSLLLRIGVGEELPEIPDELSEEGKDFLSKCLVKDPAKRWTAEMLLNHPFIVAATAAAGDSVSSKQGNEETTSSSSPRSHFDFTASVPNSPESEEWCEWEFDVSSRLCSPPDRLRQLVTDETPNWSESENESWVGVR